MLMPHQHKYFCDRATNPSALRW